MEIKYSGSPISTVATLAHTLGVSETFLRQVAADPSAYYTVSTIAKKSGGERTISDPSKELKLVQRRIVKRIFSNCTFPLYLFGSVKDDENPRDFVRNAITHIGAVEVMAFDIDSFFPSVRPGFVKKVYKFLLKLPEQVADILVALTTLDNGLPQGAPTSSYLSNLVFYNTEHKVVKTLQAKGYTYTRLIDDITVSSVKPIKGDQRKFVYAQIKSLLDSVKVKISKRKYEVTNTSLNGKKTVVTGLVVENNKVKLPREKIKEVGGKVYMLKNMADVDKTEPNYHSLYGETSGLVALYSRLEPSKAVTHRKLLQCILPTYSPKKIKKVAWLCRNFAKYAKSHPDQLEAEGFARKYYRYKNKISIIKRTHKKLALSLEQELRPFKPLNLLSSYHE